MGAPFTTRGPTHVGIQCPDQHGRPAALAVAIDHGFAARGVALAHDPQELGFGSRDIGERLSFHGFGEEDHEVHRMARLESDANLRVLLEPSDPGPVAGAWIDDDERALVGIDRDV